MTHPILVGSVAAAAAAGVVVAVADTAVAAGIAFAAADVVVVAVACGDSVACYAYLDADWRGTLTAASSDPAVSPEEAVASFGSASSAVGKRLEGSRGSSPGSWGS